MLKSVTLENYKCFKDKTKIEIAPLTILCGVNSSGKSSILKSLLMLKQSYENESSSHSFLLSGNYVDNGSFNDIMYHTDYDKIPKNATFKIDSSYLIRDTSDAKGRNLIKRQDIASFKELKRVFYTVSNIKKVKYFELKVNIEAQRPDEPEDSFSFFVDSNVIINYNVIINLLDSNKKPIDNFKRYIYVKKNKNNCIDSEYEKNNGWGIKWCGIPSTKRINDVYIERSCDCVCYFSGLQIKNLYADNMNRDTISTLPNLLSIFKIVAFQTNGVEFITPLRQAPIRRYNINGDVNSVGISGEKAPILLAKEMNNHKTDCIPPNEEINENGAKVTKWKCQKGSFISLVQDWMNYFDLGTLLLKNQSNGLVELNIDNHNIVDVGFGVSQALPIIVQGIYMQKDQTLILEQPEIHLHPEMQLHMADFLIALAKNEKNVIVETHSDHIINRIIKRIMEDPSLIEGENPIIRILFLDKNKDTIEPGIYDIKVDKYRGVINGRKNFFTQFGYETMNISQIGYDNYKRDKQK